MSDAAVRREPASPVPQGDAPMGVEYARPTIVYFTTVATRQNDPPFSEVHAFIYIGPNVNRCI